ncbi:sodium, potassium, lithium and rubidium/H(+) antiporter [Weizmannia acidilactici]|uniref:Sodium, potassium, lithium and rubidium/H(+) antiporter n=1 Tax=Weizmannia acidilactici TaxID=2607726 RepID=A0A5J4JMG3_9BACI|nr:Na+/H+ antiporter [Weizmannia acidilactici]GER71557.1 sodium, potassium, lithium and rubidium/H(+) antiporter [Weizmannia acidilactici]GER73848.1 sodium, potassium, lithium and rubidium/H(+) antiporter [Weizmannia acidilactici]
MDMFLILLILLLLVGISDILNHFMPFIPVPLIQIVLGLAFAAVPVGAHIPLEPDLFFVLFIAPLLFYDGRNVSREAMWKLRWPILLLALGLVFVTVFVVGYVTHLLIPSIPLAAAFALAAILSPTDVVAVSAISERVKVPRVIMHLLQGEGLLNDASSLVAFKFAVAAAVTGSFSLAEASGSFLLISIGGFFGGSVLAYLIIRFRVLIRRLGMEDVTVHMLIQILTPFFIYLAAEHMQVSGILAVVACGMVHAIEREREQSPNFSYQVVSRSTWTVLTYILNGLVFVLLGQQMPGVLSEIWKNPEFDNGKVISYIIVVTAALLLLRFLWVYGSWWLGWKSKKQRLTKPSVKHTMITTVSGVRGAVTLAGAFSIPYYLVNGEPFPERSLLIFIAAGVILLMLLIASVLLPVLARRESEKTDQSERKAEKNASIFIKEAAIQSVRKQINDENREAAAAVIADYQSILHQLKIEENEMDLPKFKRIETDIRMKALDAETHYIESQIESKRIDREMAFLFLEYIRRMEIAVTNRMKFRLLNIWVTFQKGFIRLLYMLYPNKKKLRKQRKNRYLKMKKIKIEMAEAAIQSIKSGVTEENREISFLVISEYRKFIRNLNMPKNMEASLKFTRQERELQEKAFQAERNAVQSLFERGKISRDTARKLRRQINIREVYWMEEHHLHA